MPRARGISRLNIGPPSPRASTTISSPTLRIPLSSALAMALFKHLLDHARPAMRHVLEDVERVVGVVAADQVQQRPQLPHRDPCKAVRRVILGMSSSWPGSRDASSQEKVR